MAKSRLVPVFDGHNDTLLHLAMKSPGTEGDFLTGRDGHIDLPKAKAGGLAGGLFAMFTRPRDGTKEIRWRGWARRDRKKSKGWDVPIAGRVPQPTALNAVMAMMASLLRVQKLSKGQVKVVTTHRQLTSAMDRGVLAAVMHMEGVEAIKKDLDALGVLYETGLRSLGPGLEPTQCLRSGVPFNFPDSPDIGPGLTPAGKDLVRLCNQLGILVDLSHLNEKGFWDVVALSRAPIVASHSGRLEAVSVPSKPHRRSATAVADSGGIVGVNFARAFLRKDGLGDKQTTVKAIVRHVEYIAEKIGVITWARIGFRRNPDSSGHEGRLGAAETHGMP